MTAVDIRINGLTLGATDGDGDKFTIEDIQGFDSADMDIQYTDNYGDGQRMNSSRYKQRDMTITGKAIPQSANPTQANIWRVRKKIEDALAPLVYNLTPVFFDLASPGVSVYCNCYRGGKLHFPTPTATVQPFEIPLTAPDPRKFGQTPHTITTAGTVTVTNAGNYGAYPILTLTNNYANPWIQNNTAGGRLTIDSSSLGGGTLPPGSYLDPASRQLIVAGVGELDLVTLPRTWWTLAPGDNSITANGVWRIDWHDSFV